MSILETGEKCTFTKELNRLGDRLNITIPNIAPNDKVSVIKISLKGERIIL